MKKILIFGAAGQIGQAAIRQLLADGCYEVLASVRGHQEESFRKNFPLIKNVIVLDDVSNPEMFLVNSKNISEIDGVVYTVGHCPPNGFADAIRHPLSQLPFEEFKRQINMHQVGVLNCFQYCLPKMKSSGCFVFITSAITRLKGKMPPFLQAYHYASAMSACEWLIDGMRNDPAVISRNILVHRLAPGAVDTPFHHTGPKSRLVSLDEVSREIVRALNSKKCVDKYIL
jgi:NAD(P)-dependent dehydrogenase (short-subunit alcohol dehydrogenase family)